MIFNIQEISKLAGGGKGQYDRVRMAIKGAEGQLTKAEVAAMVRVVESESRKMGTLLRSLKTRP